MRLAALLMALGGALSCLGLKEYSLCRGTTAEPVLVDLADIEAGRVPASNYLRIGPHIALLPAAVYRYRCEPCARGAAADDAPLVACYYPIISRSHPFVARLGQLEHRYGDLAKAAKTHPLPRLDRFAVLVKTSEYRRVSEIPKDAEPRDGLCGMVINRVESLGAEEERFLQAGFPDAHLERVLIVEQGRTPSSFARSLAMIGSGALLVLAGLRLFWRRGVGSF